MTRDERALRANIVAKARWMNAIGLNQGTSGNISARYKDVLLITPSATPSDSMRLETIEGMAVSLRHHEGAAGRRRDRAHALDLRNRLSDSPQGDTSLPLHDGCLRRDHNPLRCLRALWNERAVGLCASCA